MWSPNRLIWIQVFRFLFGVGRLGGRSKAPQVPLADGAIGHARVGLSSGAVVEMTTLWR